MAADRTEMVPDSVVIARLQERVSALTDALAAKEKEVVWLRWVVTERLDLKQKKEG